MKEEDIDRDTEPRKPYVFYLLYLFLYKIVLGRISR